MTEKMPKTRIVRSKVGETAPIFKENEIVKFANVMDGGEHFWSYIEYVIEEQDDIETKEEMQELREQLNAEEECNVILESANKKFKKVLKLLKEKGLGVEVLTEKLKTGERFEHFHITFQCAYLEMITQEEYELLDEVLNGK